MPERKEATAGRWTTYPRLNQAAASRWEACQRPEHGRWTELDIVNSEVLSRLWLRTYVDHEVQQIDVQDRKCNCILPFLP